MRCHADFLMNDLPVLSVLRHSSHCPAFLAFIPVFAVDIDNGTIKQDMSLTDYSVDRTLCDKS